MNFFDVARVPLYSDLASNGTVIVFDTETTGLTEDDDVVQIAVVVLYHGNVVYSESVYLRNTRPIDGTGAQKVNGLTDAFLAEKGEDPRAVLQTFIDRLKYWITEEGRVLLVAHNLSFDYKMVSAMLKRFGMQPIPKEAIGCCTKEFVKALNLPKVILPNNRLCTCIEQFKLPAKNTHDAYDDVLACLELFKFLTS